MGIQNSALTSWFSSWGTAESLCVLNTSTKTIQILEETGNYSEYTKVLGNVVQSFVKIMRYYMISNGVIGHELELDISILKKDE